MDCTNVMQRARFVATYIWESNGGTSQAGTLDLDHSDVSLTSNLESVPFHSTGIMTASTDLDGFYTVTVFEQNAMANLTVLASTPATVALTSLDLPSSTVTETSAELQLGMTVDGCLEYTNSLVRGSELGLLGTFATLFSVTVPSPFEDVISVDASVVSLTALETISSKAEVQVGICASSTSLTQSFFLNREELHELDMGSEEGPPLQPSSTMEAVLQFDLSDLSSCTVSVIKVFLYYNTAELTLISMENCGNRTLIICTMGSGCHQQRTP